MSDLDSSSSRASDELDETSGRRPDNGPVDADARASDSALPTSPEEQPEVVSTDDRTVISNEGPLPRQVAHDGLPPMELGRMLEGDQLGHYRLEEFVGGGGMGAVFRAIDTMLDRTVAVKVLSSGHTSGEESRRRFRNEAQSAARLDHENIARVYYVGEDRGMHYIVFEYIEGINVRDLVNRDGPLDLSDAIDYTLQVAEALAHASLRDVVHRDIKPSNILITSSKRAKLVDMGLARLHQMERSDDDITESGMTLGTFDYISPEQARDPRSADVRSDLYSLGCTLYFMLTGRPPFPDGTMLQKLLQHQDESAPDVRSLRAGLPDNVAPVLKKMLAKSPAGRYQKPGDLIADLLLLSRQLGLESPSSHSTVLLSSSPPEDSLLRRTLPWMAPVAVLLLCVFGLYVTRGQGDTSERLPGFLPPSDPQGEQSSAPGSPNGAARRPTDSATQPDAAAVVASAGESSTNGNASAKARPDDPNLRDSQRGDSGSPDVRPPSDDFAEGLEGAGPDQTGLRFPGSTVRKFDYSPSGQPQIPIGDLVVGRDSRPGTYTSLSEAIAAAQSGDVIAVQLDELVVKKPITINSKRLTIRGPHGLRPRIVFRPDARSAGMNGDAQSLLTIDEGELRLENLELEMDVPAASSRSSSGHGWSLVKTRDADRLRFEKCRLTIRNAGAVDRIGWSGAAFIRVGGPSLAVSASLSEQTSAARVEIQLEDCVARGRADFVSSDAGRSFRLDWRNGLLVTSERMIVLRTVAQRDYWDVFEPSPLRYAGGVEIDLQQLTADVESGLLLVTDSVLNAQIAATAIPITLRSRDSIIRMNPQATLIEYLGGDPRSLQRQFEYHGDRNYYEGVKTFWRSVPSGMASDEMDFDAWRRHWESDLEGKGSEINPHLYDVRWKELPDADRPWENRTAADYALDRVNAADNPALRGASDGGEVGFRADRLGIPPKAPLPATAPLGSSGRAERNGPLTTIDEPSTSGSPTDRTKANALDD